MFNSNVNLTNVIYFTVDNKFWKLFFIFHSIRSFEPQGRKQSLDDINLDQFLKVSNYEDTVKELDVYYGIGNSFKCYEISNNNVITRQD